MPLPRQPVVIIDDDPSVRRAIQRLFRLMGWEVEGFASAEEFLQATTAPPPACLVLDVHLPGISGLELQCRLKAEDRRVPLVFITAYGDEHTRALALAAGAVDYLQKPFDNQALLDAVGRAAAACRQ